LLSPRKNSLKGFWSRRVFDGKIIDITIVWTGGHCWTYYSSHVPSYYHRKRLLQQCRQGRQHRIAFQKPPCFSFWSWGLCILWLRRYSCTSCW
jgi:hypothetical protein